ncbi:hypothetical protein KCP77_13605 [Salmonella enterica subsp. enterica]|nr:hypothetical protein KCP77_13605 [Salmonella enterica subsp. enterica]
MMPFANVSPTRGGFTCCRAGTESGSKRYPEKSISALLPYRWSTSLQNR